MKGWLSAYGLQVINSWTQRETDKQNLVTLRNQSHKLGEDLEGKHVLRMTSATQTPMTNVSMWRAGSDTIY